MNYAALMERAEAARDTSSAREAASLALDGALVAVEVARQAASLELNRKDYLHGVRDRLMAERGLAKTPAEEEARKQPEYIEYCERIGRLEDGAHRAQAWSRYYSHLADVLTGSAEVAGV